MKNNNWKNTIEFLGLDYKKEVIKILVINLFEALVLMAFVLFFNSSLLIVCFGLFFIGITDYLLLGQYSNKKNILIKERNDEFIYLVNYFQVYINNQHNVYQSFNKLKDYVSDWMKEKIEQFLIEIDNDKTVQPFVNFANHFTIKIANNIMLSIYQMVDQGATGDQLNHFMILFNQISQNNKIEQKKAKEKSFDIALTIPMVGAGLITMILALTIISVMGEMINVI